MHPPTKKIVITKRGYLALNAPNTRKATAKLHMAIRP